MMIAMKDYLCLFLILIGFLSYPLKTFSQQQESEPAQSADASAYAPHETIPPKHTDPFYFSKESFEHELGHETDSFPAKFLNMLFILGLLIGFMILASWALKRMMKTRLTQLNTTSAIKVVETRSLSPRSTLYLLEIQGKTLLIAESPTTISLLPFSPSEEHLEEQSYPPPFQSSP